MPVNRHPDGQRSVEAETEVQGSPEQVWEAIASGPGISSWFVPTELDGRVGGHAVSHFAPDDSMDSVGTITAWEPPYRFAVETLEEPGTVASEWTVEAQAGGRCKVRIVHRWFAEGDDWDDQFEQHRQGWQSFFRLLRLYLAHYPGQHSVLLPLMASSRLPKEQAWTRLLDALGLSDPAPGEAACSAGAAPELSGTIEFVGPPEYPEELLIRLDRPTSGLLHMFAIPLADSVLLSLRLYLYGDRAADIASVNEPIWRSWLAEYDSTPAEDKAP